MQKRVDELLYRAWHYFDIVLVAGLEARRFLHNFEQSHLDAIELAIKHIAVFLYIRDIGAEDCIAFSERLRYCLDCLNEHAANAGMVGNVEDMSNEVAQRLRGGCQIRGIKETATGMAYALNFYDAGVTSVGLAKEQPFPSEETLLDRVSLAKAKQLVAATVSDATLARLNHAALGQVTRLGNLELWNGSSRIATTDDVALHLSLPVIELLPVRELLAEDVTRQQNPSFSKSAAARN
jgi:hypothetical protein